ncbi:MAG: WG repeat-containing protein [Bacteroidales bacterium]
MKRIITHCMFVMVLAGIAATAAQSQNIPDLIPYRYGDKWGYADQQMKMVVQPVYDKAFPFYGDIAVVQLHFRQGLIDRKGNPVTPVRYHKIGRYNGDIGGEFFPFEINDKQGLLDRKGNEVIPARYELIVAMDKNKLYKVKSGDKFGLYLVGKGEVVQPEFDQINPMKEGVMVAKKGNHYGLLDQTGKILITPEPDYIWDFDNGTTGWYKVGEKFGFVSNQGVFITGADYEMIWSFAKGFARVQKGGKIGFINEAGKEIVPAEYDYFSDFHEGYAVLGKDGKYGYIDTKGKFITDLIYDGGWTPTEGLAKVKVGDNWGFINTRGKMVIPASFENCGQFSEGLAPAVGGGKVGYIDTKGEWLIHPKFELGWNFENQSAVVIFEGKASLISTDGTFLTSQPFDSIGKFKEGLAPCWIRGKEGRINATGKVIIPPAYDMVKMMKTRKGKEYLAVSINDKQGLYTSEGVRILDAEYVFLNFEDSGGLVPLAKDGKYGFCDTLGNMVIPFDYSDVTGFTYKIGGKRYTGATRDGKQGVLNSDGQVVIPFEYKYLSIRDKSDIIVARQESGQIGLIDIRNEVVQPFSYVDYYWEKISNEPPSGSQFILMLKPSYTSQWVFANAKGEVYEKPFERELVAAEEVLDVPVMRNTVMTKLKSGSNDEQYEIYISLPFDYYKTNKTYPVVYLADGDMLQGIAAESSRMMSFDNTIPEVIIVGIGYGGTFEEWYANRIKDLTPTDDPSATLYPGGGGCEAFYSFVLNEVIPYVDQEFRVAGNDRTFAGYSLGGLFGAWMLFNKPAGTFNRYMLISPSLWWDKQLALKWEEEYAAKSNSLPVTLFMSLSSSEWGTPETLNDTLSTRNYEGLNYTWAEIEGENHYSTFPAAFAKGMNSIFKKERELFMIK